MLAERRIQGPHSGCALLEHVTRPLSPPRTILEVSVGREMPVDVTKDRRVINLHSPLVVRPGARSRGVIDRRWRTEQVLERVHRQRGDGIEERYHRILRYLF